MRATYGKAISRIRQRDVLLVRFPFSDAKTYKTRPVLVLSNSRHNNVQEDIIVCPLTTNLKKADYSILVGIGGLDTGELKAPSRIRADKIAAVEKGFVVYKIGVLDNKIFEKVTAQIFALLSEE